MCSRRALELVVGEREVVVEGLVGVSDRELVVEDVGAGGGEHLLSSACAQTAPKRPVLAPTTATGFGAARCRGRGGRPSRGRSSAGPGIEALYSGVAIRSASAAAMRGSQALDRRWGGLGVEVLGVRGDEREVGVERHARRRREEPGGGAQQRGVERVRAQAARDAENDARSAASATSSRWTDSWTLQESTSPPRGSWAWKVMPQSRRSISASRSSAARCPP